jgi:hypothetical protein
MEVAPALDEPALPAATVDLPSAPIRKAIKRYRAAGIGRAQLIAAVDLHGAECEQQIAARTLASLTALRADLDAYRWIRSFPSTGRALELTTDPSDLDDLAQELQSRAQPESMRSVTRRLGSGPALAA